MSSTSIQELNQLVIVLEAGRISLTNLQTRVQAGRAERLSALTVPFNGFG